MLILHPFSSGRLDGQLRVDFLDVGQGDSALVTMPDGTTLLVDGGGRPSFAATTEAARRIGETVVSEYLWWRGLSEIDYVVATHADADHIDGLNDVLKNFSVRGAFVGRTPANDSEFAKFTQTLVQTRTHLERIQAGDVIKFGDVEVSVIWPPAEGDASDNNDSVVLRIKFGERSILLTGDIEKATEKSLVASTATKMPTSSKCRITAAKHLRQMTLYSPPNPPSQSFPSDATQCLVTHTKKSSIAGKQTAQLSSPRATPERSLSPPMVMI